VSKKIKKSKKRLFNSFDFFKSFDFIPVPTAYRLLPTTFQSAPVSPSSIYLNANTVKNKGGYNVQPTN